MNNTIKHFGRNTTGGRDFICGDCHGWFSRLHAALVALGFNGFKDRLFSVGDLVDRGPESHLAPVWLRQPWFHAVRGNHEQAAIAWNDRDLDASSYRDWGGGWNIQDDPLSWRERASLFATLPLGIELETESGLVGIVHADCPAPTWQGLKDILAGDDRLRKQAAINCCLWSRDRHKRLFDGPVTDVRAVVVGHTEVQRWTSLDNVIYIDTGGWNDTGHFTILDAATLRPADAITADSLDWSGT